MRINRKNVRTMCLSFALCALGIGCVAIPVNFHTFGSRQNVNEKVMEDLQPGTTTKENVFLALGEPDEVSVVGNCLTYNWKKVKALWFAGAYYTGDFGTIEGKYNLILCFDIQGFLVHKELKKRYDIETKR